MARPLNEFGVTEQQEKFCRVFVETGNASEAYRQAYKSDRKTANSVAVDASRLLDNPNVHLRISMLREGHAKRHNVTVDSLVAELEEIKQIALAAETPQTSAAVSAVMGKAKLTGLDKQVVEMTGTVAVAITAEDVKSFRKAFDRDF